MRYVILGAGAVGGTIGARLCAAGHDVALIARGDHARVVRADGLLLRTPDGDLTVRPPVHDDAADVGLQREDVVIVAVKSQHTTDVLDRLAQVAPERIAVVCAQNGVDNERQAARRFPVVIGMHVMVFAAHLRPGVVHAYGTPRTGVLDVGRYPTGVDAISQRIAADLDSAGFSSRAVPDIMRRKYGKLLANLTNILQALGTKGVTSGPLAERVVAEALEVMAAAGHDAATSDEQEQRREGFVRIGDIPGAPRGGGSTWQSLARGQPTLETDHLNGEIVLLGRLVGVPTPLNAALQSLARQAVAEGWQPGLLSADELERRVAGA